MKDRSFSSTAAFLIILAVVIGKLFSQTAIDSPIKFSSTATIDEIEQVIRKHPAVTFSEQDFLAVEAAAMQSQNSTSRDIVKVNQQITELLSEQQDLQKIKDVSALQKELEEKQKNKEAIRLDAQSELSQVSRKGLYLVVLSSIDYYLSKEKLSEQAKAALAPKAIEDIRGIFIQSLEEDSVDSYTRSFIRGTISGQMTIETVYLAEKRNEARKFIYFVKVSVAPLKKIASTISPGGISQPDPVIVSLSSRSDEPETFANLLSLEDGANVYKELEKKRNEIDEDNTASKKQEQTIIQNTNKHIADLEIDILQLQNRLADRIGYFRQAAQKLECSCPEDINVCVQNVFKNFAIKFSNLEKQKNMLKEREIVTQRTVIMPEGEPARDIAGTIQNLIKRLNTTYGKVEQFIDITKSMQIEGNGSSREETSKITTSRADVTRSVDSVKVHINPKDNGFFEILLSANFKINSNNMLLTKDTTISKQPANTNAVGSNLKSTETSTENLLEQDITSAQEQLHHLGSKKKSRSSLKRWLRFLSGMVAVGGCGAAGYYVYEWDKNCKDYNKATEADRAIALRKKIRTEEKNIKLFSILGGVGVVGFGVTYVF